MLKSKISYLILMDFSKKSGEGGIRTHAPFRTNGFQDRLVMTASIPLQAADSAQKKKSASTAATIILSNTPPIVNRNFEFFLLIFFGIFCFDFCLSFKEKRHDEFVINERQNCSKRNSQNDARRTEKLSTYHNRDKNKSIGYSE